MNQAIPIKQNELLQTYALNEGKVCNIYSPNSIDELSSLLKDFQQQKKGFSLLGGRNSFGDVFIPAENAAVDLTHLPKQISINQIEATATVDAGVRSYELLQNLDNPPFYLPAQTGSYFNTLGGDISANVNGKDSWKHGNFYYNIIALNVLFVNGEIVRVDKQQSDLFNALVAGLGLVGIILSAELKLKPKISDALLCKRIVTKDISETISCFKNLSEEQADFAYAWGDCLPKGKNLGRSIIETARFVEENNLSYSEGSVKPPDKIFGMNDDLFWWAIRNSWGGLQKVKADKAAMKIFNLLRYNYLKRTHQNETIKNYARYQYPVSNILPNWNKKFISRGMQEMQCLFGYENFETAVRQLVQVCYKHSIYPELFAIRRHRSDDGFLSFSGNGLSCTINYNRNNRTDKQLYALERDLVETVIKYSGKIYLAKFPYLSSREVEAMYPAYEKFRKIKFQYDPHSVLTSASWKRWTM